MRKIILSLSMAFIAAIALSSCTKDYNCKCTYDSGGKAYEIEFVIEKANKKDAEELCTYNLVGAENVNCELL